MSTFCELIRAHREHRPLGFNGPQYFTADKIIFSGLIRFAGFIAYQLRGRQIFKKESNEEFLYER
jgi:hypothetical protein